MTLVNSLGLPESIVAAVANDPYNSGGSDISVTRLISPAYQRKRRMEVEVVEDVADRIWSLLGQSVHHIIERAYQGTDAIVEKRFFMPANGWVVSGQVDVISGGSLDDYKVTSVWSVIGGGKIEWERQLNLLRLLAHHNGIEVDRLRIIAILRDWSKPRARVESDYPASQVAVIPVELWSLERAEQYLLERVMAHQDPDPPPCSDEERWRDADVFAVIRDGRKRATRLYDNEDEAKADAVDRGPEYSVERRPGGFRRCEGYCDVSAGCPVLTPTPF